MTDSLSLNANTRVSQVRRRRTSREQPLDSSMSDLSPLGAMSSDIINLCTKRSVEQVHRQSSNLHKFVSRHKEKAQQEVARERHLLSRADAGDPQALYQRGKLHYDGNGICINKKDHIAAFNDFYASAIKGNVDACRATATCYRHGHGITVDVEKAKEWMLRAVDLGDVHSVYCYAQLLEETMGAEMAIPVYHQAALLGHRGTSLSYA